MLLIRFREALRPLAIRPFVLMGQSSLQVFSMHFLFCFLGIGMVGNADRIFGWKQAALIVGTFAGLLLIAQAYARPELTTQASSERRATPNRAEDRITRAA